MSSHNFFNYLFSIFICTVTILHAGQSIDGIVSDSKTGKPIENVHVILETGQGTATDKYGIFLISTTSNNVSITFSHIGYETKVVSGEWSSGTVYLTPAKIRMPSIYASVNKVIPGVSPVSWSILNAEEIKLRYSTQDAPMIISSEPGVYAYSESGNGTGYSYVSIRGFDQSRIAIMLDNVSLNDNESHQVYWVDHGDILSDADEVEIQRGIGKSLYGAAAFGGSINVNTKISQPMESYRLTVSSGSYNTNKIRVQYYSGESESRKINWSSRLSLLESDGYRLDSDSQQLSGFFGGQYKQNGSVHEFRAILGKEESQLQWDGITRDMLSNRHLRTGKMDWTVPFTDDFFQQIYSLNSFIPINKNLIFRNTVYLVKGSGFYEIEKNYVDLFSYNLDVMDNYSDEEEMAFELSLNRKKWIENLYYGFTPVVTREYEKLRIDAGAEIRKYSGDHFGEVSDISNGNIAINLPDTFRYYDFTGDKTSVSFFVHMVWNITNELNIVSDIQSQNHYWDLSQKDIGHFSGYDISADWNFINPRIGFSYEVDESFSIYSMYGTSSKEPSDVQILEADDVYSQPQTAAPEKIHDLEIGFSHRSENISLNVNLYKINYKNEIISDIYDFEDNDFEIVSADFTIHEGVEFETDVRFNTFLNIKINGSILNNYYRYGRNKGNQIVNSPANLFNVSLNYRSKNNSGVSVFVKHVGRQFIDSANTSDLSIDPYSLTDISCWKNIGAARLSFSINNLFDHLYETYGYTGDWGSYYWPGATRNFSIGVEFDITN
ncbi:MAG: TonB-dependent receptor [Candidatus Marinimicrobia bacterium]|nr:TonB-dependent receptor [Candidatus Neomarinimicrobiota bacterium]MBT3634356.1 TonB-dependent receptor [Candidatus Neomarinimicrobiota bacterium]MBT3681735.1 TonB-dependent receptor [Candidatus Neomarinimicrobiota bacterium]MBT3759461.1 TonB-dependent receptor [Candidatus Neomarinimicrobiota bacterium]MBT3895949.1 TonB-dependent receptor [Candidatus Neomarinimicrobiota bacterium]